MIPIRDLGSVIGSIRGLGMGLGGMPKVRAGMTTSSLRDRYSPVNAGGLDWSAAAVRRLLTPGSARTPWTTLGYVEKVRSQFLSLRHHRPVLALWAVGQAENPVERILSTYQSMCPLDAERAADSKQKISRYVERLASAGQRDAEQLTIYGLAYLTELHEGQDPRFTGC
jgi:hypothetical protein